MYTSISGVIRAQGQTLSTDNRVVFEKKFATRQIEKVVNNQMYETNFFKKNCAMVETYIQKYYDTMRKYFDRFFNRISDIGVF